MDKKWNEKTTVEKTAEIISGIALVVWLVIEALGRKNMIQYADIASCIAVSVICICQAFAFWNVKRVFSYIAIAGTVLLVVVAILFVMLI